LHALPSLHEALVLHAWQLVSGVKTQPVCVLHESLVQALLSLQASGVPVRQVPLTHVSVPLHGFPSLHVPLPAHAWQPDTSTCRQPFWARQLSLVQGLLSLQLSGPADWQAPPAHVSVPLHTLPSSHDAPSLAGGLLHTPPLQTSLVQAFSSSQSAPEPQTPTSFEKALSAVPTRADTANR
jgi:hypothetical protein